MHWFPMRVTYRRELKVKDYLDTCDIECFVPMQYQWNGDMEGKKRVLQPAIHNLIFVHSTQQQLTELKMTRQELLPMRYIMLPKQNGEKEILTVPDRQMENFIRVASVQDDSVMFLTYSDFIRKEGRKVRVIEGTFAGVEGVVKRIKNNKHVVVQIEGLAAVAITFVPPAFLQFVNDTSEQ